MERGFYFLTLLFLSCSLLYSCKPQVPGEYLQPDEMEDILYDYHIALGMLDDKSDDGMKRTMYEMSVLREHGVSQALFDSSLVYYSRHSDRFQKIYENLTKRLGDEAVALGASASDIGNFGDSMEKGDTANVWKDATSFMLATLPPNNVRSFTLSADTAFHNGDKIVLSFKTQFIFQDGYKDGVALLAVRFSNDSVATRTVHLSESTSYDLAISDDARLGIKNVSGFITLQGSANSSQTTLKLMFVENVRLIRCHVNGIPSSAASSVDVIDSVKADGLKPVTEQSQHPQPVKQSPQPLREIGPQPDKLMRMTDNKLSDKIS